MKNRLFIACLFSLLTGTYVNAQWFQQTQVTNYDLNSVHCIDDNTCYAVGFKTNVFKTTDGGATPWFKPGGTAGVADKFVVKMLNKDTVLIGQDDGTIKMTTTGSTTSSWSLDIPISNGGSNNMSYYDIAFNSKSNFVAVGGLASNTSTGGRLIASSVNSGATWNQVGTGSGEATIFGMENLSSTKYVAVGGAKTIYRSTNAGVTWTKVKTGGIDTAFYDVHFPTKAIGYAVGGAITTPSAGGIVFKTQDSGKTWSKVPGALAAPNTLYGVHFVSKDTGYVVGNGGIIQVTTNGGTSWTKQISPVSTDLNKIYFPSKDVGYIVGKSGVILKTTNGGFIPALVVTPGNNQSVCPGFCATIGGTTIATGGTPPYTYSWSPITGTNTSLVVCPTTKTTYSVTVKDVNNVSSTGTVSVSIHTVAAVSFSGLPTKYCLNGSNLTLTGTPSGTGGVFTGNGITGSSFNPVTAGSGTHSVSYTYTDNHGCIKTSSTKSVTITTAPSKGIMCMVTVDSTNSTSNIVIWQKPVSSSIDSFRIYRKNSSGALTYRGSVAYSAPAKYIEASPLADPNSQSYSYAVSIRDTCGTESAVSDTNSTMFLYVSGFATPNVFTLRWSDYYGFTPTQYEIWRKDDMASGWVKINTVPVNPNQYVDATLPPSTSRYRLRAVNPSAAGCAVDGTTTVRATFSNITADYTGIPEPSLDKFLSIYPNPNHGTFTFQVAGIEYKTAGVKVFDMFGKLVYESTVKNHKAEISIPGIAPGIYQLQLITDKGTANKKITIQ